MTFNFSLDFAFSSSQRVGNVSDFYSVKNDSNFLDIYTTRLFPTLEISIMWFIDFSKVCVSSSNPRYDGNNGVGTFPKETFRIRADCVRARPNCANFSLELTMERGRMF